MKRPNLVAEDGHRHYTGRGARWHTSVAQYRPLAAPFVTVLGVAVAWQVAVVAAHVSQLLLPSPLEVIGALVKQPALFVTDTRVTIVEVLLGFVSAVVLSMFLAVVVISSRLVNVALYPVILFLQSVPKIALAPLLLVWIGYGTAPKILVALLTCFFPVFLDTVAGLASVPEDYLSLFRSLESSRWQILIRLRFPYALPQIFVGLKVGITFAVIGAVVAEFVSSTEGLGFLISSASNSLETALAFAGLLVLTLMSIVLFYAVVVLERVLVPWARVEVS